MTSEERMIRVTDEEYKQWQKFVRDFDDELREYDVPRQLWVFNESKSLEPAPPKDWRPFCFSGWEDEQCRNYNLQECDSCKGCPYRKRD